MSKTVATRASSQPMTTLSRLLFPPHNGHAVAAAWETPLEEMSREEFDELVDLANLNHVIMRAMEVFRQRMLDAGDDMRAGWASAALATERARIENAAM